MADVGLRLFFFYFIRIVVFFNRYRSLDCCTVQPCNIWFSAPSLRMDGGLESRCLDRVYGADGAVSYGTVRTINTTYVAALKTIIHPQTRKTMCCNSASNAPDGGRMYPKYVELRTHQ